MVMDTFIVSFTSVKESFNRTNMHACEMTRRMDHLKKDSLTFSFIIPTLHRVIVSVYRRSDPQRCLNG
jgi:hypothetical protein